MLIELRCYPCAEDEDEQIAAADAEKRQDQTSASSRDPVGDVTQLDQ